MPWSFNKKNTSGKSQYSSSVCFKVTNKETGKVAYILGAVHRFVLPTVKQRLDNFVYTIRPQNVYFEIDLGSNRLWHMTNYLTPFFLLGTEYYIHRSASQIGSRFHGLESGWYQLLLTSPFNSNFFSVPFHSKSLQRFYKKFPFLGLITHNILMFFIKIADIAIFNYIIGAVLTYGNILLAKRMLYIHDAFKRLDDCLHLIRNFLLVNVILSYNTTLKIPAFDQLNYIMSNFLAALDVRNEDWVDRVIAPRLEGEVELSEDTYFFYELLNDIMESMEKIFDGLVNVGYNFFRALQFVAGAVYQQALLAFNFIFGIKTTVHPAEASYKKYNELTKIYPSLSYPTYLLYCQKNKLESSSIEDLIKAFASFADEEEKTLPAGCADLYVVGAAHLRAPAPFLGWKFNGVIDLLEQNPNFDVEEIDMDRYDIEPPLQTKPLRLPRESSHIPSAA